MEHRAMPATCFQRIGLSVPPAPPGPTKAVLGACLALQALWLPSLA